MDERVPRAAPRSPFEHVIRVGWGDCDPANIAYTARLPAFALEAIDAWWEHELGHGWFQINNDVGFGTPFVHLDLDFTHPVTPRHRLVCRVVPTRLGETSLSFRVSGFQNGTLCFEGNFTCVIVDKNFAKQLPPEPFLSRIRALIAAAEATA